MTVVNVIGDTSRIELNAMAIGSLKSEIDSLRFQIPQRLKELENEVKFLKKHHIKDVRFFWLPVAIDTQEKTVEVPFEFPEDVDAVALESLLNDGNDMAKADISRTNDEEGKPSKRHFVMKFTSARGENVRWIPVVRVLGIQILR